MSKLSTVIFLVLALLLMSGCADKRIGMPVPAELGCEIKSDQSFCLTYPGNKIFKYVITYRPEYRMWKAAGMVRSQGKYRPGCRAYVTLNMALIKDGVINDVLSFEKKTSNSNEFAFEFFFEPEKPFDRVAFEYEITCR